MSLLGISQLLGSPTPTTALVAARPFLPCSLKRKEGEAEVKVPISLPSCHWCSSASPSLAVSLFSSQASMLLGSL